jgi:hypothetical protein
MLATLPTSTRCENPKSRINITLNYCESIKCTIHTIICFAISLYRFIQYTIYCTKLSGLFLGTGLTHIFPNYCRYNNVPLCNYSIILLILIIQSLDHMYAENYFVFFRFNMSMRIIRDVRQMKEEDCLEEHWNCNQRKETNEKSKPVDQVGIKLEERERDDVDRSDELECRQLDTDGNNHLVLKFHKIRKRMKKTVNTTAVMSSQWLRGKQTRLMFKLI